jgi:hypothetical protein
MDTKLKAEEQKILGDLGEDAVSKLLGPSSQNLNLIKHNFPIFDIIDKGNFYNVKTRRKYTPKDQKLNTEYNIVRPSNSASRLSAFFKATNKFKITPSVDKLFWVAIPYEEDVWCPVYYGKLIELPDNPITEFFESKDVFVRIKMKEKYTQHYNILGYAKIDIKNKSVEVKCSLNEG